ncbi:EAL domain-containing protein, partial [Clostridium cuniculi]|uniref:EAL domain-containing protein n=1 Tax=Clostridium cuniculi TaxID=2548455 RepID=UPI0018AB8C18
SLNEIENEAFVKKAIQILYKSNLEPNKICLEIIERVKINDLDKINKNIDLLKGAGFKIAIDDFGVEYSNL